MNKVEEVPAARDMAEARSEVHRGSNLPKPDDLQVAARYPASKKGKGDDIVTGEDIRIKCLQQDATVIAKLDANTGALGAPSNSSGELLTSTTKAEATDRREKECLPQEATSTAKPKTNGRTLSTPDNSSGDSLIVAGATIVDGPLEPPLLRNANNTTEGVNPPRQPGAYHQGGFLGEGRVAGIEFSVIGSAGDEEMQQGDTIGSMGNEELQQADTSGLVVANLANEDEDEIPQSTARAVNLDHEENEAEARHRKDIVSLAFVLGIVLVVIIVVVLLVVFLVLLPEESTESESSTEININPTNPPTSLSLPDQILNLFPYYSITTIHEDPDRSSPQSRAYQWLLGDPNLLNYTNARKIQRFALATLYYSTTPSRGLGWTNASGWLDYGVHECDWAFTWINTWLNTEMKYNINLKGPCWDSDQAESPGEVYRHLGLNNNNLQGSIPEEIYLLTSLKTLLLDNNELEGTLSTRIGDLSSSLEFLSVAAVGSLTGTLPSQIGRLSNLWAAFLYTNFQLGGTIPTQMGLLTNLERLGLFLTSIHGTIPEEFAPPKAINMFLSFNQLTGTVPLKLTSLPGLMRLILRRNQLSGTIPSQIGLSSRLWQLNLDDNHFTGTIPRQLGSLVINGSLLSTNLTANELSGTIPPEMCFLMTPEWQNRTQPPGSVIAATAFLGHDCGDGLCGCRCSCG